MADNQKRINGNECLYVANLVCFDGFDGPTVIRGYLTGDDEKIVGKKIESWIAAKLEQNGEDNQPENTLLFVRGKKLCDIQRPPDLAGVEDIDAFLESRDQQKPPIARILDSLFVPYEEQMKDFIP